MSQSFVYQNILASCVLHNDSEPPDETVIDEEAPIVVEMNKQFGSPGSTVNLSGQDLSDWVSMQSLCARLSRSDNAKSIIYLDHCNLGRHGAAIVSRSFTHVLIRAGNYVAKWLPLMHQNGRIIVLSMINNDIGPDGAAAVATMLRVNTSLRELNLRFNSLKSDGAQYLASALYVNNSLRFLCLSGNELCGLDGVNGLGQVYDLAGISALFRALHVNTRLKTLKIAENDIGNDGAKHLADALRENKCLSVLDIHGNDLFGVLEGEVLEEEEVEVGQSDQIDGSSSSHGTNGGGGGTPQRLGSKSADERETGEGMDYSQGDQQQGPVPGQGHGQELKYELSGLEGGGSLLIALGESKYLSSVDISWNEMGPKGAILFASSLLNNSTLTYLDIHGNFIGDDGVSALCLYLKGSSCKLSVLYMQQVGMTPCGALLIAEVLGMNNTLTKLNMAHNVIESTGAYKLALSLRSNAALKDLNLRNCQICSEGISHLANMLQYNRSLTILNISNNDIEDDGAIAISVTLSLNPTLETLDMSNYQPISSVPMTDPDDLPLAVSTHSKRSSRDHPHLSESHSSVSASRSSSSLRGQLKHKRIGESGMEALAHAITGNIRLSQLILNGHDLSPKMCQDLLNAMNESRVCRIIADFKSFKWKENEICLAMKAEREFLSSCYTPQSLRIHLCGQTNSKKQQMLQGWETHQHHLPWVWSHLFRPSSSDLNEIYGLEIMKLTLQSPQRGTGAGVGAGVGTGTGTGIELNVWCYDGFNQFHEIHRLHLRATPLSVVMIAISSVGLAGQCRSAAQVAAEAISWIRLLITFGHQVRDIAMVITNGILFDKAWHGVDPCCVGVPSAIDELGHSRSSVDPSTHSNLSAEKRDKDDDIMTTNTLPESSHGSNSFPGNPQQASVAPSPPFSSSPSASSPSASSHLQEAPPSEEQMPLSIHNTTAADLRRKFEESIHEQISSALGWKRTPQMFCWDEGERGAMPSKIDHWLAERYKSLSQHVQVPNICSIIHEQVLPAMRNHPISPTATAAAGGGGAAAGGGATGGGGGGGGGVSSMTSSSHSHLQQVVSMNTLLKQCKQHVKCLQLVELRQACQWLHLLGDIVMIDTMELDSYERDMWNYLRRHPNSNSNGDGGGNGGGSSNSNGNGNGKTPFDDEQQQLMYQHYLQQESQSATAAATAAATATGEVESEIKTEINEKLQMIESKRLKIQIDLELMKSQAPKRNCKIILNPHWFTRYILLGFIYQSTENAPTATATATSTSLSPSSLLTASSSLPSSSPSSPSSTSICAPNLLNSSLSSSSSSSYSYLSRLPTSQPWCSHEYKYTFQQIYDYLLPFTKTNQLNSSILTLTELLIALEVQKIGVILPSISSFCLPSRLYGNKLKWLSERQVMKMSLSQFNGGLGSGGGGGGGGRNRSNPQNEMMASVTSAIGKRIKCKFPYLFPPSTFSCLQSHILHTWISEKEGAWKYHRVVLWERGIGITIEQPPVKMNTQRSFRNTFSPTATAIPTATMMTSPSPPVATDTADSPPPPPPPHAAAAAAVGTGGTEGGTEAETTTEPNSNGHILSSTSPTSTSGATPLSSPRPAGNGSTPSASAEAGAGAGTGVKDFPIGTGSGFICILIEMTSTALQPDWSQSPDSVIDVMIWGEGVCDHSLLPSLLSQFTQAIHLSCQIVSQGALRSEGASVDALQPPLVNWLKVLSLRPGCFLHTLASQTNERNCGEYQEDVDATLADGCSDFNDPLDSPILVRCHHLQPRLLKSHLCNGYVLAESPGQGKGLLRSVYSSLERGVEMMNQEMLSGKNNVHVHAQISGGGVPGTPTGGGSVSVSAGAASAGGGSFALGAGTGTAVGAAAGGGGGADGMSYSYDDYIYDIQSSIIASE